MLQVLKNVQFLASYRGALEDVTKHFCKSPAQIIDNDFL